MVRDLESVAAEWVVFRDLTAAGRSADVIELADRIVAESDDQARIAQALIEKLVARLNLCDISSVGQLLDQITAALRKAPVPRLIAEFHAMAGLVAYGNGSLSTAVTHLVHSERAVRRMTEVNLAAVDTWHDLSVAYSEMGFHTKALEVMQEGRRACAAADLPIAMCACMETLVRQAVVLDQHGSTQDCVDKLHAVVQFGRQALDELVLLERVYLRYAVYRLAALGHPVELNMPCICDIDDGLTQVNELTAVCEAIACGEPAKAIALLDDGRAIGMFGSAEPYRLRSLALSNLGDHAGAAEAERAVLRLVTAEEHQLRDRFIDSVRARLDQERLRRVATHHANAALSDPLTGLPNRRCIETFVSSLVRRKVGAVVGALDLDGFKAVNDTHGHPSGDLVLQRVAGILAQSVRHNDLLARYGGDEFILVLPTTTLAEAGAMATRIIEAVEGEDWHALVPGTPVSISIGWAKLTNLPGTLIAADEDLYRVKRARRAV